MFFGRGRQTGNNTGAQTARAEGNLQLRREDDEDAAEDAVMDTPIVHTSGKASYVRTAAGARNSPIWLGGGNRSCERDNGGASAGWTKEVPSRGPAVQTAQTSGGGVGGNTNELSRFPRPRRGHNDAMRLCANTTNEEQRTTFLLHSAGARRTLSGERETREGEGRYHSVYSA